MLLNTRRNITVTLVLLLSLVTFTSCDLFTDGDGDGANLWNTLSSYEKIGTMSSDEISGFYPSVVDPFLAYDVMVYRIVYRTEAPNGNQVQASGLVLVPVRNNPATLLSLHRSAIFHESEAPSNVSLQSPSTINTAWGNLGFVFGSAGFITVMPDLLGWGSSSNMLHPFMITISDGMVGFDMLLAAAELFESEDIRWNGELFAGGYSQGGTSALALARAVESDPQNRFEINKASAGGGAYNIEGLTGVLLERDEITFPPYYAFFLKAYRNYYFPIEQMNRYFNSPYDLRIVSEQLFRGGYYGDQIADRLTTQTDLLIRNIFRQQFISGGEPQFREALMNNDLTFFSYETPLRIYHGENDQIIPYSEAVRSFDNLRNSGSENVSFYTVEEGTHQSAAETFFYETFLWFLGQN
jgi:pimeloyl-ACP methyl ester carboxylesterase